MGSIWKKFKSILKDNLYKNFKKIVERIGIWLIGLIQISVIVVFWWFTGISVPELKLAAEAAYTITAECAAYGIGKIFKNGNNGNTTET